MCLTKHAVAPVVQMIRATGHDQPLFERREGLQFRNGDVIVWGQCVVQRADGFLVLDGGDSGKQNGQSGENQEAA